MSARISPGGALLRSSRLFTLPAPIPPPPGDFSGGSRFNSDTATLAYPTHQVVTTSEYARNRGDWGLKRELPLKSTKKTSNPLIRVKKVDSVEHITDFTSAGDHGVTLRKWQELNTPVTAPNHSGGEWKKNWAANKSVFEQSGDFTVVDPEKELAAENHRWKFRGPWLAGMTEGEFKAWLEKKVRPQRHEFRRFIKQIIAEDMSKEANANNMDDEGLGSEMTERPKIDPASITEEQLNLFLRQLRVERPRLFRLISRFLDLAPINPPSSTALQLGLDYKVEHVANPYAVQGPPVTHPSAGLSYLRTGAFLENHPIYGPQKEHAPVEARVIKPRTLGSAMNVVVGVGGFITHAPGGKSQSNRTQNRDKPFLTQFRPEIEGGAKLWVKPTFASISSTGRVELTIDDPSEQSVEIAKELMGKGEGVYGKERHEAQDDISLDELKRHTLYSGSLLMGSRDSYGLRP